MHCHCFIVVVLYWVERRESGRDFPRQRQIKHAVDRTGAAARFVTFADAEIRNPLEPFLQKLLDLGARQERSGTAMRPIAKCGVQHWFAGQVDVERITELALVKTEERVGQLDLI